MIVGVPPVEQQRGMTTMRGPLGGDAWRSAEKMRRPPRSWPNAAASLSPSRHRLTAGRAGTLLAPSADGITQQIVELAHLDTFDERGDFRPGVNKCWSFWVP